MASVAKRRWTYKGQAKEGWEVRYFDEKGVRRSVTKKTKKEADAVKRQVERELEDGTHLVAADSLTIGQICTRYVEVAEQRAGWGEIGHARARKIEIMCRLHITPHIGNLRFREINPARLDDFYATLNKTQSPFVARMIVSNLGTIERFAVRRNYTKTQNVAVGISGLARVAAPKVREFTIEQVRDLMARSLKRRPGRRHDRAALLACAVHLAACCGLRDGEIRALDWKSINLAEGVIHVTRNFDDLMTLKGPKSDAGVRDVHLPEHLIEMLEQWRQRFAQKNAEDLVFTSMRGRRLRNPDLNRPWRLLLMDAGLTPTGKSYRFHSLRHFAASWWIENGLAIPEVARALGHADAVITMKTYAHSIARLTDRQAKMREIGRNLLALPAATLPQQAA